MEMENLEYGMPVEEVVPQTGGTPDTADAGADTPPPAAEDMAPGEDAAQPPEAGEPGQTAEVPPKKKRATRKKTDKAAEGAAGDEADGGEVPMDGGGSPVEGGELSMPESTPSDSPLPETDQLNQDAGVSDDCIVMGLADLEAANPPDEQPPEEVTPPDTGNAPLGRPAASAPSRPAGPKPKAGRPADGHSSLFSLKLNELDRDLTERERQEWNDIYASYRAKSVLTGRIIGVDGQAFNVRNRETGRVERRTMYCAVIISYRVKVLIPETEMWMPGEERPAHVLRNMSGAEIDYVILDVDREGGVAIGSRRMGALIKQRAFDTARGGHKSGEMLSCRILTVGPSQCLVECAGRDITLRYRDISYASFSDLREKYHPGETLDCILKEFNRAAGKLVISVKEATANPFDGVRNRHPIGSRRQAVISGKYAGGVFCTMPDDTTCLCLHTPEHADRDFREGDTVILVISKYDYERSLVYGRILSKW